MMHQGNVGNYRLMMPQANPVGWMMKTSITAAHQFPTVPPSYHPYPGPFTLHHPDISSSSMHPHRFHPSLNPILAQTAQFVFQNPSQVVQLAPPFSLHAGPNISSPGQPHTSSSPHRNVSNNPLTQMDKTHTSTQPSPTTPPRSWAPSHIPAAGVHQENQKLVRRTHQVYIAGIVPVAITPRSHRRCRWK
jgi:hypothetical protein